MLLTKGLLQFYPVDIVFLSMYLACSACTQNTILYRAKKRNTLYIKQSYLRKYHFDVNAPITISYRTIDRSNFKSIVHIGSACTQNTILYRTKKRNTLYIKQSYLRKYHFDVNAPITISYRTIDRSNFKSIVHIGAIPKSESTNVHLVAVTQTGKDLSSLILSVNPLTVSCYLNIYPWKSSSYFCKLLRVKKCTCKSLDENI